MKKCIPGGSPIPMPDTISTPAEIGKFSDQVIRSLAALRDRPLHAPSQMQRGGGSPHPWKVTSNGDDTIRVAEGMAYHWTIGESDEGAALDSPIEYEGSDSETVSESGESYIYAKMPVTTAEVAGGTSNRQLSGTVTIENETDPPTSIDTSSNVWLLLAVVTLEDGVVTVDDQKLKHNPTVSIQDAEAGGGSFTPQWKVTANGNDTITVAAGTLHYAEGADEVVYGVLTNAEEDITVTTSGTLYYRVTLSSMSTIEEIMLTDEDFNILNLSVMSGELVIDNTITSGFGDLSNSSYAYMPVAEIVFSSGVASVTNQYAEGAMYLSMQSATE